VGKKIVKRQGPMQWFRSNPKEEMPALMEQGNVLGGRKTAEERRVIDSSWGFANLCLMRWWREDVIGGGG